MQALNYNEHAWVEPLASTCIYACRWGWLPSNWSSLVGSLPFKPSRATSSSFLPNRAEGAMRHAFSAFDQDVLSTFHSNQGTPTLSNPVWIQYDFEELNLRESLLAAYPNYA